MSHRLFNPSVEPLFRRHSPTDIYDFNLGTNFNQLGTMFADPHGNLELDDSTLLVHTDGGCRNNGYSNACAAFGVFFGPDSQYNTCGLLHPSLRQTSIRAEIHALEQALVIVQSILQDSANSDLEVTEVYFATDSEYLVNCLTRWMPGWKQNGGRKADGKPVAHFKVLEALSDETDCLVNLWNEPIYCRLWHVPRSHNEQADHLVKRALNKT